MGWAPRVAVLSASEQVDAVPSMKRRGAVQDGRRGQIGGGLIDAAGLRQRCPPASAQGKHPRSAVAGADVCRPRTWKWSMLVRQSLYLAGATACGVIVGARVPITVVTHRLDSANTNWPRRCW